MNPWMMSFNVEANVEDVESSTDEEDPIILWMSENEEKTSGFVQWWTY